MDYQCPSAFFFDEYRGVCVEHGTCLPAQLSQEAILTAGATTTHQLTQMGAGLAAHQHHRVARQFEHFQQPSVTFLDPPAFLNKPTEDFRFSCKEIGPFADFDSGCVGLWECDDVGAVAKFVKCPAGLLFDPIQRQCISAFLVKCLPPDEGLTRKKSSPFNCQGKKSSAFYADLTDGCRKFHHCTAEGDTLSYTCPFDWIFNEVRPPCIFIGNQFLNWPLLIIIMRFDELISHFVHQIFLRENCIFDCFVCFSA